MTGHSGPQLPPVSSKRTKLGAKETQMEDIVLGEKGAAVMVGVLDKDGNPVPDASVRLLADPAGLSSESKGSWLHHLAFRQQAVTSAQGNARFAGVPAGRILVRVKTSDGTWQQQGVAVSNQELRVSLRVP